MDWLDGKINNALLWIMGLFNAIFDVIINVITDVFISIVQLVLDLIVIVFTNLKLPSSLSSGFSSVLSSLPDSLQFFLNSVGFPQALLIFGAGVIFRLTRKAFTLGQW